MIDYLSVVGLVLAAFLLGRRVGRRQAKDGIERLAEAFAEAVRASE